MCTQIARPNLTLLALNRVVVSLHTTVQTSPGDGEDDGLAGRQLDAVQRQLAAGAELAGRVRHDHRHQRHVRPVARHRLRAEIRGDVHVVAVPEPASQQQHVVFAVVEEAVIETRRVVVVVVVVLAVTPQRLRAVARLTDRAQSLDLRLVERPTRAVREDAAMFPQQRLQLVRTDPVLRTK